MNNKISLLIDNMEKAIVGKTDVIKKVICSMLCGGHVLIEDVPGVGKTQLVSALAKSVNGRFNRIQLTPDIMPSDIVGFSMVNSHTHELEYKEGVAMCNFLLADEINRASPKSQSSLLEIMEEHQISLDGKTHKLPEPFMTLATQNPVETYGTYHLPEAQMDRFLMKLSMGYPDMEEELRIMEGSEFGSPAKSISAVLNVSDITGLQEEVKNVTVARNLREYIVAIAEKSRNSPLVDLGISPRGSIALLKASKAYAFIEGRDFVIPDDILAVSASVLAHRIMLSGKGRAEGNAETAIKKIIDEVPVPIKRKVVLKR